MPGRLPIYPSKTWRDESIAARDVKRLVGHFDWPMTPPAVLRIFSVVSKHLFQRRPLLFCELANQMPRRQHFHFWVVSNKLIGFPVVGEVRLFGLGISSSFQ